MLKRLIITGPNGAGKSHLAARLAAVRPDVPVISFDAMKLTSHWRQRSRALIEADLSRAVQADSWIIEGGPSLLPFAINRADSVMWMDPPEWLRAWRLIARPLRNIGRTRKELPQGNVDWPWQQYKFAMRSIRNRTNFRTKISAQLAANPGLRVWRIRNSADVSSAIDEWRGVVDGVDPWALS
ncbi:DNA topology modulation protein FlaR [Rhizobium sp. AN80A]|uniref:DNA topology modulation protein FlaR n=1 Tax=Rhizobium sp. AN80A TaxID=3040673 RepID=UPI0024B3BDE8|nr:DNA topology modulation protein FlaR [Rhizobium sp. AN80A]